MQEEIYFFKTNKNKNGLTSQCKNCYKEYNLKNKEKIIQYQKEYREQNKEKNKKYRKDKKDQIKLYNKNYRDQNKNIINNSIKMWRENNSDKIKNYSKEYYKINKEKILNQRKSSNKTSEFKNRVNDYRKNKYQSDLSYKISSNVRSRICKALKRNLFKKSKHTIELLNCSIDEYKIYLEGKFEEGMTWENYGLWHIDHIRPCSSFDLSDPEQQKLCFHYTNTQPMWANDNHIKGSKYDL